MQFTNHYAKEYDGAPSAGVPQIHALFRQLRLAVGGIEAKRTDKAPFPVKSAKELMQRLAQAASDLDIAIPVVDAQFQWLNPKDLPVPKEEKRPIRSAAQVTVTVRFVAPDGSFIQGMGVGIGFDTDDKAGGKASTYAYKDAILKTLGVPERDLVDTDDEADIGVGPSSTPNLAAKKAPEPASQSKLPEYVERVAAAKTEAEVRSITDASKADLVGSERAKLLPFVSKRLGEIRAANAGAPQ